MNRLLIGLFAALGFVVLAIVFLWPGARTGPEPIAYGHDACAQCRMILGRPGFAGEVRTADGVLRKYDDLGCLLQAMIRQRTQMPEAWVEDRENGRLVSLLTATLVRLHDDETPMRHGLVAFADAASAERYISKHAGMIVALEDLVRDPTRLVRAAAPANEQQDTR